METIDDLRVRGLVLDHIWQSIQRGEEESISSSIRAGVSVSEVYKSMLEEQVSATSVVGTAESTLETLPRIRDESKTNTEIGNSTRDKFASLETESESRYLNAADQLQQSLECLEHQRAQYVLPEEQSNLLQPHQRPPSQRPSQSQHLAPGSTQSFGNLPLSSAVRANHFPIAQQQFQLQLFCRPEWQIFPHWEDDQSPLGGVYTQFQRFARARGSSEVDKLRFYQGVPLVNASLLFRKREATDLYNADNWASELQRSFGGSFTYTAKLAGLYMLALFMRWLIYPTADNYAAVPAMIRPTLRQRFIIHPSSVDLICMPSFRDALVEKMRPFVEMVAEAGVDVNWPHSLNETVMCLSASEFQTSDRSDDLFVTPQFAIHAQNPKNWILGKRILKYIPEVAESEVSISDIDVLHPVDRWL